MVGNAQPHLQQYPYDTPSPFNLAATSTTRTSFTAVTDADGRIQTVEAQPIGNARVNVESYATDCSSGQLRQLLQATQNT